MPVGRGGRETIIRWRVRGGRGERRTGNKVLKRVGENCDVVGRDARVSERKERTIEGVIWIRGAENGGQGVRKKRTG